GQARSRARRHRARPPPAARRRQRQQDPAARPRPGPVQVTETAPMNIAILGGTGKEGSGLATRWALVGHAIIIGSRDAARAHDKAVELRERTKKLTIVGKANAEAAALGDVVVIALPATGLAATLPSGRSLPPWPRPPSSSIIRGSPRSSPARSAR